MGWRVLGFFVSHEAVVDSDGLGDCVLDVVDQFVEFDHGEFFGLFFADLVAEGGGFVLEAVEGGGHEFDGRQQGFGSGGLSAVEGFDGVVNFVWVVGFWGQCYCTSMTGRAVFAGLEGAVVVAAGALPAGAGDWRPMALRMSVAPSVMDWARRRRASAISRFAAATSLVAAATATSWVWGMVLSMGTPVAVRETLPTSRWAWAWEMRGRRCCCMVLVMSTAAMAVRMRLVYVRVLIEGIMVRFSLVWFLVFLLFLCSEVV